MEYDCETWLGYNCLFRENVAASANTIWAKIDATLWNKAFTEHARAQRCQYCFSLTHKSEDCDCPQPLRHPGQHQRCQLQCPMSLHLLNHIKPKYAMPGTTPLKQPAPIPIVLASTSACNYCANDNHIMHRHYTASAGKAGVQQITGNLLQSQSSELIKEPTTATSSE